MKCAACGKFNHAVEVLTLETDARVFICIDWKSCIERFSQSR